MPGPAANRLTREHRARLLAVADEVQRGIKERALRADVRDIDAWWLRSAADAAALVAAAWRAVRELAETFLVDHAAAEGRRVDPVPAEWNTERAVTALRVTGPVAFKTAIEDGHGEDRARRIMAERMAGAAERLTLGADRDTLKATFEANEVIVGWRRVSDGDPCYFCAMLISRGAVYRSAATAGGVVIGGVRFGGDEYHDNDGCTAEPLYEHEEEPEEVDDLYRQWLEATAGHSGKDAIRAWRRYWDNRPEQPQQQLESEQQPEASPVVTPQPERPERDPVNAAFTQRITALTETGRRELSGGMIAKTDLVTFDDGSTAVYKKYRAFEGRSARSQQDAEELAPQVLRAFGFRAPAVYRKSASEIFMAFVDGDVGLTLDKALREDLYGSDEGRILGLVDAMMDNHDRNDGNWMIGDEFDLVPIDHGLAFAWVFGPDEVVHPSPWVGFTRFLSDRRYVPGEGYLPFWLDNDLSPQDIATARERWTALKPEFERLGHLDWFENGLRRLALIEPHAKGSKVRIR